MDNLKKALTILSLLAVIVLSHLAVLADKGSLDDKSNYRANAYMSFLASDALLPKIYQHMNTEGKLLNPALFSRYEDRVNQLQNYRASNIFILIYERFPLFSAYQSVFFAEITISFIAVLALIYALRTRLKYEWPIFIALFVISAFPFEVDWYPLNFRAAIFSWTVSAPRGAVLIFYTASMLIWHIPANREKKIIRWFVALALLVAGFAAHMSTSIMLFLPSLLIFGVSGFLRWDIPRILRKLGPKVFFTGYFLTLGVIASAKYILLNFFFYAQGIYLNLGDIYMFAIPSIIIYLWLFSEKTTNTRCPGIYRLGDTLSQYFVAFSAMFIGTNLIMFDDYIIRWDNYQAFLLTEFTNRMSGITHLFFWLLLGTYVYRRIYLSKCHLSVKTTAAVLLLVAVSIFPLFPYVTLFLASLSLWIPSTLLPIPGKARWVLAFAFLAAGFILHAMITGLYFILAGTVLVMQRWKTLTFYQLGIKRLLVLYNLAWLLISIGTFVIINTIGSGLTRLAWESIILGLASNVFLAVWWKSRATSLWPKKAVFPKFLDGLILYFIVFSVCAIGAGLFALHLDEISQPDYLLREAAFNLSLLSIILLCGLIICFFVWLAKNGQHLAAPLAKVGFAAIFLWTCFNYFGEITRTGDFRQQVFDPYLLDVRISDLIAKPGISAYENEILYYQGIANEFREHLVEQSEHIK